MNEEMESLILRVEDEDLREAMLTAYARSGGQTMREQFASVNAMRVIRTVISYLEEQMVPHLAPLYTKKAMSGSHDDLLDLSVDIMHGRLDALLEEVNRDD